MTPDQKDDAVAIRFAIIRLVHHYGDNPYADFIVALLRAEQRLMEPL